MKNNFTHKISAVLLAFLILFSSTSFTIAKHICKQVESVVQHNDRMDCCVEETASHAMHAEKSCCETELENHSEGESSCEQSIHCDSDCCFTSNTYFEGKKIEQIPSKTFDLKIKFLESTSVQEFNFSYFKLLKSRDLTVFYHPPSRFFSHTILFQVFRI